MRSLLEKVAAAMMAAGYDDKEVFGVRLALEEAVINGIKHGHRGDPTKTVHVRWRVDAKQARIELEDEGPGFDPHQVPDPLAPENLEKSSGRGLLLMRTYMTWIRYNERGNQVTLCKQRSALGLAAAPEVGE